MITCDEAAQYLAAIFDGEGTVSGHTKGRPEVSISNTDAGIITATCECLDVLCIDYYITYRNMKNPLHSQLTTIRIGRRDQLDRFEELVPVRSQIKCDRLRKANERPRNLPVKDRPIAAIKRLRREHKSWRVIGEELGFSAFAVHTWAKQAGIPTRECL